MFKKFIEKKKDVYIKKIELSKKDKEKIDKKLDPLLKDKRCPICKNKKVFMDGFPLKIEANKKFTKNIFHRHLFVRRYCENCGYSQFFDLKHLGVNY